MTTKASQPEKRDRPWLSDKGAISTGCTLLNLACSDHPDFGFIKGRYYYLVGDSASGKTWLSMTCFAEACRSRHWDDYDLIFDDVEAGAMMDIEAYFGKKVADRIQAPKYDSKGNPIYSDTVESFYFNIWDRLKSKRKFIYVLDSQDALVSEHQGKKFNEKKKSIEKGEEVAGSYGDGKAKYHSEHIRMVVNELRKTDSILIIIGQTRDNLGFGFAEKTRSGGKALRFYATLEIWTSVGGKIEKTVNGKPRTIGTYSLAEVKKNRVDGKVGKDRSAWIPILQGVGIDDVGCCVDYLIDEKRWLKCSEEGGKRSIYDAHDIFFKGSKEAIIRHIEEEDMEAKVRGVVAQVWREVEEKSTPIRKKRYE